MDIGKEPQLHFFTPSPDGVKLLQTKSDRVDQVMAGGARFAVVWLASRSLLVTGRFSVTGGRLVSTPGGGGGTCWHRNCSRTKRPRPVGAVSSGLLVRVRKRACPSTPERSWLGGNSVRSKSCAGACTLYTAARSEFTNP